MGSFRTLLALVVVFQHLGATGPIGALAVFGFYVLSGYLMTMVLNETYAFDGFRFGLNRALRLLAPYYLVALPTLLLIALLPQQAAQYHAAFDSSAIWRDGVGVTVINNLLIFPMDIFKSVLHWTDLSSFRLVPPAWSVSVEMLNYALLWAFIARGRWPAMATFIGSVLYHAMAVATAPAEVPIFQLIYAPFYAALLPFSIGALIYFLRDRLPRITLPMLCALLASWIGMLVLICTTQYLELAFYGGLILVSAIVAGLSRLNQSKLDTAIGEYSYPIFLTHWLVGFMVSLFLGVPRSLEQAALALPAVLVLSWAIIKVTKTYIDPLRDAVRTNGRTIQPAQRALAAPDAGLRRS